MPNTNWPTIDFTLGVAAAAGLAVDSLVHLQLASDYSRVRSELVGQDTLFRAEGVAAAIAAVALLARSSRLTALGAFVVGAAGVAAVLAYTYVDVGQVGPLPDMYEPVWYPEKLLSCIAEAVAGLAAGVLLVRLSRKPHRRAPTKSSHGEPP